MIGSRRIHRVRGSIKRDSLWWRSIVRTVPWPVWISLAGKYLSTSTNTSAQEQTLPGVCRSDIIITITYKYYRAFYVVLPSRSHSGSLAAPPQWREAYVREPSSPAERADSQLRIESNRGPTNPERLHLQFTHSSPPTPLHPLHRKDQSPPVLLFIRKASDRGPLSGRIKPVLEAGGKGKTQPHFQARRERHLITSPLVCLFVPEDRHLSFVHSDLSRSVFLKIPLYTDVSLGGVHPESTDTRHRQTHQIDK